MKNRTILLVSIVCLVSVVIAFVSILHKKDSECQDISKVVNGYSIEKFDRYQSVDWIQKEIKGNVKVPGIYEVPSNTTLMELISYSGGLKKIGLIAILEVLIKSSEINGKKIILKSE